MGHHYCTVPELKNPLYLPPKNLFLCLAVSQVLYLVGSNHEDHHVQYPA